MRNENARTGSSLSSVFELMADKCNFRKKTEWNKINCEERLHGIYVLLLHTSTRKSLTITQIFLRAYTVLAYGPLFNTYMTTILLLLQNLLSDSDRGKICYDYNIFVERAVYLRCKKSNVYMIKCTRTRCPPWTNWIKNYTRYIQNNAIIFRFFFVFSLIVRLLLNLCVLLLL